MPMRQILKQYTKSELAVIGWRSTEIAYNMDQVHREHVDDAARRAPETARAIVETVDERELRAIEARLGPVVYKMVDEKTGDVDLRKLTGDEAMKYCQALGIPIGGRM